MQTRCVMDAQLKDIQLTLLNIAETAFLVPCTIVQESVVVMCHDPVPAVAKSSPETVVRRKHVEEVEGYFTPPRANKATLLPSERKSSSKSPSPSGLFSPPPAGYKPRTTGFAAFSSRHLKAVVAAHPSWSVKDVQTELYMMYKNKIRTPNNSFVSKPQVPLQQVRSETPNETRSPSTTSVSKPEAPRQSKSPVQQEQRPSNTFAPKLDAPKTPDAISPLKLEVPLSRIDALVLLRSKPRSPTVPEFRRGKTPNEIRTPNNSFVSKPQVPLQQELSHFSKKKRLSHC